MTPGRRPHDLLRRVAASVLVVLYAFLATVGGSLVICQEADGCVAIEWRGADCCDEEHPSLAADAPGASVSPNGLHGEGDCAECEDESASGLLTSCAAASARLRAHSSSDQVAVPVAVATCPRAWTTCPAVEVLRPRTEPIPPPPLAALRTVVLRC